ncbi:MAG: hypothetical protein M3Z24_15825 [Chloroflexota bacterium]|nr:hypothetical protein [Chloroflexota bacterium]
MATHSISKVNRMGVNGKVSSNASVMPSTTATLQGSSVKGQAVHRSSSKAGQLLQSFDGVSDLDNAVTTGFVLTPPDQGLCVGTLTGQKVVIEPVNISFRIFSTTGTTLFGPAPISFLFQEPSILKEFISDPRCQYDKSTGDFFFTVLAFNSTGSESHIDVTVLHQDGNFFTYRFDSTDIGGRGCPCFADQPLIGLDKYNIYVSGNEFPIAQPSPFYNGAEVYAISKSQLAANTPANYVEFSNLSDQGILIETLQPAITYDNNAPAEYLLHSFVVDANGNNTSFDRRLGVFAITNQAAVTQGGTPTLSNPTVINSEAYAQPNPAPEPSGLLLNADDDRMQQVQYINGNLMGALSTAVLVKGDTTPRDGAAWFDIEPSLHGSLTVNARIKHQGYIAASGLYILYPAIAQNKNGTVEMAFSITSSTINPSAAYAVVPDETHSKNAGAVYVAATGSGSYFDTFTCSGTLPPGCRWGDYSWITLDPNTSNFWMGSEYVPPLNRETINGHIINANWGTRLYEVGG